MIVLLVKWGYDPHPGANLLVWVVFEFILSKIDIVEVHSN
jgi:hypothetical protein